MLCLVLRLAALPFFYLFAYLVSLEILFEGESFLGGRVFHVAVYNNESDTSN
jgi:hypothetical protein